MLTTSRDAGGCASSSSDHKRNVVRALVTFAVVPSEDWLGRGLERVRSSVSAGATASHRSGGVRVRSQSKPTVGAGSTGSAESMGFEGVGGG